MPAAMAERYDNRSTPWEASDQAPIRGVLHYANSALIFFDEMLTLSGNLKNPSKTSNSSSRNF